MNPEYRKRVAELSLEKALAIAAFGESVAAYRYRTLAEKSTSESQRAVFEEMADEEQGHHIRMDRLLKADYPGSDFVLTAADKELVTVGPRMIEVNDEASFKKALTMIHETELLTGHFYAALHDQTRRPDLQPLLKEMSDECFEHAGRIDTIIKQPGG